MYVVQAGNHAIMEKKGTIQTLIEFLAFFLSLATTIS